MLTSRWLAAAPAGWDELCDADPNATAAHRPEFWRAAGAALAGLEVRFLALESERGALAGGMLAGIERRGGLEALAVMPWVLPGAPLARAGAHRAVDAAAAAALAALQRERRVTGGVWALYRPEGPAFDAGEAALPSGTPGTVETALIPVLAGIGPAWRALDRKTRQALARERERMAFAEEPGALGETWTLHARQSRRWAGHRPLPLEFGRRLLQARDARGEPCARLFTVRDRDGLLSGSLALDGRHEVFLWWSGTRAEGRARHAFAVLAWSVVEWAAARGRRRVNLGASPGLAAVAAFKDSLGAESYRYPVRWLDARHAPWRARLLAALRGRRAPAAS